MAGAGTRALPNFRVGEGDAYAHHVVRGRGQPGAGGAASYPEWGPAPLWAPMAMMQQWCWQRGDSTVYTEGAAPLAADTPGLAAAAYDDSEGRFHSMQTAASINSTAGARGGSLWLRPELNPVVGFSFKPGLAVTNVRYWVSLTSASPMASAAVTGINIAGFRYDTSAGDTRWRCMTNNGGAAAVEPTMISTPTAPSTSVRENLLLAFKASGTVVEFWRSTGRLENGDRMTLLARATSTLPSVSGALAVYCQVRALDAVAKSIRVARIGGFFS